MMVARSDAVAAVSHEVARFACGGLALGRAGGAADDAFRCRAALQPRSRIRNRPLSPAAQTVYETVRALAAAGGQSSVDNKEYFSIGGP